MAYVSKTIVASIINSFKGEAQAVAKARTAQDKEINKALDWDLPTDGPKTLNGLILEHLEDIPDANTGLKLGSYLLEILQIKDNQIITVHVRRTISARIAL